MTLRRADAGDHVRILGISKEWPDRFVARAYRYLEWDLLYGEAAVHISEGQIDGFVIWNRSAFETELLWLAVRRSRKRQGIGRRLVNYVGGLPGPQTVLSAKTTDPISRIRGTEFDGSSYAEVLAFFASLDFSEVGRISSYWGPDEHCIIVMRDIRSRKENIGNDS